MYLTPKQVQKQYGYHPKTLANWADEGKVICVKSPGGHRRYLASSLEIVKTELGEVLLYARVSTASQKDDLKTQIEYLGQHYPGCQCISEIGSGLNFKRKKFMALMERVAKREIKRIVVAHKDRLCRFGFDFVEWFCKLNSCEIVVLNNIYRPPHQELMEDFMSIMHCFSSKLYFLRKYEKQIRNDSEKVE
jgi:putative resolvase